MSSIDFEYLVRTPSTAQFPNSVGTQGAKHSVAIEHPLTPVKLALAEQTFVFWLLANKPGCHLLEWAAKDPGTGTIYSNYRSKLLDVLEGIEDQKRMIRRHEQARAADASIPWFEIVGRPDPGRSSD